MSGAVAPASWALGAGDADYPPRLGDLAPGERPRLHGVGDRAALAAEAMVTIVGARRASGYGLRVAERLGRELALAGVTVVSGMARGIDAAAHRGALAGGATTIAVLAGGPDVAYPASNRGLYAQILATGAAISEHRPATVPQRRFFAMRNRIMAALGGVVVIVEAAEPSGSLITADVAIKLGRSVGAVPGQVDVPVAAGTNALIASGAHLVTGARDVLDLLFGVGAKRAPAPGSRAGPPLDPLAATALGEVARGSATVDAVAAAAELSARDAAIGLTRLELLGYVELGPCGFAPTGLSPPDR